MSALLHDLADELDAETFVSVLQATASTRRQVTELAQDDKP